MSISSSSIRSFMYRPAERRLDIAFGSGGRSSYREVPAEVVEDMRRSFSKGDFFNAHIRDRYDLDAERPPH